MVRLTVREAKTLAWLAKAAAASRKNQKVPLPWNPSNVRIRGSVATVTNGLWVLRRPLAGEALDEPLILPLSLVEGPLSDGKIGDEHFIHSEGTMVSIDGVEFQRDFDADYPRDEGFKTTSGEALSPSKINVQSFDLLSTALRRLQVPDVRATYCGLEFSRSIIFILQLLADDGTEAWIDLKGAR